MDYPDELESMARKFFKEVYTMDPQVKCQPNTWSFPHLNHSDLRWLNRLVGEGEVKVALFQINGRKAAGEDGISGLFLQKYWNIVGESITKFVLQAFSVSSFNPDLNRVLISLIPKQSPPEYISQFRPISLCNLIIKGISKVIVNKLKPLMVKLTAENQASFVPSRQAADNIMWYKNLYTLCAKGKERMEVWWRRLT